MKIPILQGIWLIVSNEATNYTSHKSILFPTRIDYEFAFEHS